MAKRDIDKQIEQIRKRLVVLNRQAIVYPQPTPAKEVSAIFSRLICRCIIFHMPSNAFDELGHAIDLVFEPTLILATETLIEFKLVANLRISNS